MYIALLNFMKNSWFVIANPTSGNKKLSKKWKEIKLLLTNHQLDFSLAFSRYRSHEIELVHNAIKNGFRNIIVVGGDGTLHNVVNGIMTQRYVKSSNITLAVIPKGTGNDWIKTYNIPKNLEKAVALIVQKKTILQDIGFIELENTSAYFNNVAGIGYDGHVANKLKGLKRFGSFAYLLSGLFSLFTYKSSNFTIKTNNKTINTKCLMTIFGICKFSGGGMMLTDCKSTNNGLFDVTIAKNFTFFNVLFNTLGLYSGKILTHKKVTTLTSKSITVIPPKGKKTYVQADGEVLGTGKVTATIVEKAINFVVG